MDAGFNYLYLSNRDGEIKMVDYNPRQVLRILSAPEFMNEK
jgi:hypothetical protein